MRQRELGLAHIAGTSDMPIDGQPPLASPAFGRGNLAPLMILRAASVESQQMLRQTVQGSAVPDEASIIMLVRTC